MMQNLRTLLVAVGTALVLTACGGGGGGGANAGAGNGLPVGATSSVEGFLAYMQQLVSDMSETLEPITLPDSALPTTETVETSV